LEVPGFERLVATNIAAVHTAAARLCAILEDPEGVFDERRPVRF
jgi:hypothetical protein